MKRIAICLLSIFFVFFINVTAQAVNIDLNDFFADPSVTVAPDGSSALMEEDPVITPVLLANDPGLGDPFVIQAPGILSFDYDFVEAAGDNDEFGAFVLDSSGFSAGPAFEFSTQVTSSSTVSFDISSLVIEPFLGLQFQLSSLTGDVGFDSTVTVSNVCIETSIPEPGTLLLVCSGLGGLFVAIRRKQKDLRA